MFNVIKYKYFRRSGYGVLDDVANGQKYLGLWSDDKKNGLGLLVTLDGNFYEGLFTQDLLSVLQ